MSDSLAQTSKDGQFIRKDAKYRNKVRESLERRHVVVSEAGNVDNYD